MQGSTFQWFGPVEKMDSDDIGKRMLRTETPGTRKTKEIHGGIKGGDEGGE